MSNENTPSNAGKEHNPDGLTPEQVGEGWRLLTKNEVITEGDEWWNGAKWKQTLVTKPEALTPSGNTYRRRTTPPTGETVDYIAPTPETDAFITLIDDSEIDLGQVEAKLKQFESERNAAQRENDRLRKLIEDAPHGNDCDLKTPGFSKFSRPSSGRCTCWKARAATEEGK